MTDFGFKGNMKKEEIIETKNPEIIKEETPNENREVLNRLLFTQQEKIIINTFTKFYNSPENIKSFIDIIGCKTNISIRLIEHFITCYSKINNINLNGINIYNNYDQQLKTYHKKYFDPFSRGERIPWFTDDYCIITTIAQLNFFKWFISMRIQEYIEKNYLKISEDMITTKRNKPKKRKFKSIFASASSALDNVSSTALDNVSASKLDSVSASKLDNVSASLALDSVSALALDSVSTTESPIYIDVNKDKKTNSIKLAQSLSQTLAQISKEINVKKQETKKLVVDFMF